METYFAPLLTLLFIIFCVHMACKERKKHSEAHAQLRYWVEASGATHFRIKDNVFFIYNRQSKLLCKLRYHPDPDDTANRHDGVFSSIRDPELTIPKLAWSVISIHNLQKVMKQVH